MLFRAAGDGSLEPPILVPAPLALSQLPPPGPAHPSSLPSAIAAAGSWEPLSTLRSPSLPNPSPTCHTQEGCGQRASSRSEGAASLLPARPAGLRRTCGHRPLPRRLAASGAQQAGKEPLLPTSPRAAPGTRGPRRPLTLDLILLSGNGFASSTEILNLADQLKPKKMKKMEVEQVLQQLVQKKWLCEKEGEYTLHIRSILELEQYIFRHYPESARKCHICHSLSIQSQVCEDCGIVLHCSCLSKYFQAQPEPRCPHCKQFWPHKIPDFHPPSHLPTSARRESRKASRMGSRQQQ